LEAIKDFEDEKFFNFKKKFVKNLARGYIDPKYI